MTELKDQLGAAKEIIDKHFPEDEAPQGLLLDIVRAIRDSETKGYNEGVESYCEEIVEDLRRYGPHAPVGILPNFRGIFTNDNIAIND
jgi:hypothetical protein